MVNVTTSTSTPPTTSTPKSATSSPERLRDAFDWASSAGGWLDGSYDSFKRYVTDHGWTVDMLEDAIAHWKAQLVKMLAGDPPPRFLPPGADTTTPIGLDRTVLVKPPTPQD